VLVACSLVDVTQSLNHDQFTDMSTSLLLSNYRGCGMWNVNSHWHRYW
jgi:hypothetical protein